ncbi:MAG: hypothetical protein AAF039_02465 [Bacteroidota bacterium]
MEEIYSETPKTCGLLKARPETVSFLMAFSRSYQVADYENVTFERFLN